jgi:hypothetical protein
MKSAERIFPSHRPGVLPSGVDFVLCLNFDMLFYTIDLVLFGQRLLLKRCLVEIQWRN